MMVSPSISIRTQVNGYALYDMRKPSLAIERIFQGREEGFGAGLISDASQLGGQCSLSILDERVDKSTSPQQLTAIKENLMQVFKGEEKKVNQVAALLSEQTTQDLLLRVSTAYERQGEGSIFIEEALPLRWVEGLVRRGLFSSQEKMGMVPVLTRDDPNFFCVKKLLKKNPSVVICGVQGVIAKEWDKKLGLQNRVRYTYMATALYRLDDSSVQYDIDFKEMPTTSPSREKDSLFGEKKLPNYGTCSP